MNRRLTWYLPVLLLLAACAATLSGERSESGIAEDLSRRTPAEILGDESTEARIRVNLSAQEPALDSANISVTAHKGVVLLAGQVPTPELKQRAVEIASEASTQIRRIHDQLEITGNIGLLARSGDALVSTRIRASLLTNPDVGDSAYRVVTENGTVYLMGVVSRAEGDQAANLASEIGGVTRVIKLFEYLD